VPVAVLAVGSTRIQCAMRLFAIPFLLFAAATEAAVYKCVDKGITRYADQPCAPAAQPATLPPVTTVPAGAADDLVRQRDERLGQQKAARDKADAAFVESHAKRRARENAVRAAIIDHQVIEGMTPSEVQSALGSADEMLPSGAWRYRRGGQRITITFKNAVVSGVSSQAEKNKK
jgi:hypothetical protein